ncbi:TetR/AcrR family transcriptional regulator [Dactylosporangium sp. NPDC049140]|uniref:TetR/AcrR family transcriptional regulator n=1 Tax=Dactylosporangium sp. NPDC049140 TaxID=3155647 RepID=UPI0033C72722
MGRPRSFDRAEALERAMAVFWEYGYDATSVALLTTALGIGPPSLYAAFGDKRSLFLEALDHYLHTHAAYTERVLADEPNTREAVERLLCEAAAAFTTPDRPHGCMVLSAATNSSPQSADIAARLRDQRAGRVRGLEARIAGAVRAGELPAGTDPHALAAFYAAVLQGMSAQARDGATTADLLQIVDMALLAWPRPRRPPTARRPVEADGPAPRRSSPARGSKEGTVQDG